MSKILTAFLCNEEAIKRYIARFMRNSDDAEEIAQETFAKAFAAEASGARVLMPKAYLFRTAKNLSLDALAKKTKILTSPMEDSGAFDVSNEEKEVSVERAVIAREQALALARAIAALPPKCRRVFILRKIDGLPHKEIARRLGVSIGTVEKQIATGLEKCAGHLRRAGHDPAEFSARETQGGRGPGRGPGRTPGGGRSNRVGNRGVEQLKDE